MVTECYSKERHQTASVAEDDQELAKPSLRKMNHKDNEDVLPPERQVEASEDPFGTMPN